MHPCLRTCQETRADEIVAVAEVDASGMMKLAEIVASAFGLFEQQRLGRSQQQEQYLRRLDEQRVFERSGSFA